MWMGRSIEGGRESSSINQPYGSSSKGHGYQHSQFRSYNGSSQPKENDDWRSRLVQNGQWLGEKMVEYGVKLARRGSHNDIPDHQPMNDGRANWMADIRNVNQGNSSYQKQSYNAYSSGYQNEFSCGSRPTTYTDQGYRKDSNQSYHSSVSSNPPPYSDHYSLNSKQLPIGDSYKEKSGSYPSSSPSQKHRRHSSTRRKESKSRSERQVKKNDENKKKKKKKSRSKKEKVAPPVSMDSSSESQSDSTISSIASSESDQRKNSRKTSRSKMRKSSTSSIESSSSLSSSSTSSEEEEEEEVEIKKETTRNKKTVAGKSSYNYSFDPSKLVDNKSQQESVSRSQKKKTGSKKCKDIRGSETPVVADLLDVDSFPNMIQPTSTQHVEAPIDQLAGLHFDVSPMKENMTNTNTNTYTNANIHINPNVVSTDGSTTCAKTNQTQSDVSTTGIGLGFPGSELVNLDSLVSSSETPKKVAHSSRTLNELQQEQSRNMTCIQNPQPFPTEIHIGGRM